MRQFCLEDGQRIADWSMADASLYYLAWIYLTRQDVKLYEQVVWGLNAPVPRKLYLPMVSDVAALSNRKENFDFDLDQFFNFEGRKQIRDKRRPTVN